MRCPRLACNGYLYEEDNRLICLNCGRVARESPPATAIPVPEYLKKKIAKINS